MSQSVSPNATSVSRRNFIRNSAFAAGFYIIPRSVLGRGFIAPSDKLRIAGIGAGGKGESDLFKFYESGKAEIIALCDVDEAMALKSRKRFPKARFYSDYREMLEKEAKNIDAVSVSTPDHMHAIQAMAAMQLGKHVYVQKPMAHDIAEVRAMTSAAREYKVVTQMGNQGASGDGVRQMQDWYNAGIIGDVHTVYCYTDRPVWPQGLAWPNQNSEIPAGFDWNLWLGTAPFKPFVKGVAPFNWRGWWDYGTGALGDMGCHLIEVPFSVLKLTQPTSASCSVATRYSAPWTRATFAESGPVASHVTLSFNNNIQLHWMDGGIQPARPKELLPQEVLGDGGSGVLFIGSKGKMMCGTYGENPQLLPTALTQQTKVPVSVARIVGGANNHYKAWVEASIAGYNSIEHQQLSSHFDIAGPLSEIVLMGNLAIRSADIQLRNEKGDIGYPGKNKELIWDSAKLQITNFNEANQFVQRTYRTGW